MENDRAAKPAVERPDYLTKLLLEIDEMDENLFAPRNTLERGEESLGTVVGWPRKVAALSLMYQRDFERLRVEAKFAPDDEELEQRVEALHTKFLLVKMIFIFCTENDLKLWFTRFSLRKNWQLVAEPDPRGMMPEGLRKLLDHLEGV